MKVKKPRKLEAGETYLDDRVISNAFFIWINERTKRIWGVSYLQMTELEEKITRLSCIEDPDEEVQGDLAAMIQLYRTRFLPVRKGMDSP